MPSETGHIGAGLSIWGVVAGAALTAKLALPTPWWLWLGAGAWLLLWVTAILGLSDGASRAFLSGTLRKSTYTQIYTTLIRRAVDSLWRRFCDPADAKAGVPTLLRAALTRRLYDAALIVALAYPVLLIASQWILVGETTQLAGQTVFGATPFWPARAVAAAALALVLGGMAVAYFCRGHSQRVVRMAALTAPVAASFGAVIAMALVLPFDYGSNASLLVGALLFVVVTSAGIALGARPALACLAVPVFLGALFWIAAGPDFGLTNWPASVSTALLIAFSVPVMLLASALDRAGTSPAATTALRLLFPVALVVIALTVEWTALSPQAYAVFLFLAVLPLFNAVFDTLSYAVTLTLMRRGLRARVPLLWGVADLALACVLFLALGATLVAVLHALNTVAGVPLVDLGSLFAGVRAAPGDYVWLYLMLFSTIVPTLLHGLLSLLGLQGIWPRAWRRPVADWIAAAPQSPLRAVRAGLALGLIWTVPLLALGLLVWGLWALGGAVVRAFLGWYFDLLLWIAAVPVGAF